MAETVKLVVPKGVSIVGWAQKEYEVVKGIVEVDVEAVEHLLSHGLTVPFDKNAPKDE